MIRYADWTSQSSMNSSFRILISGVSSFPNARDMVVNLKRSVNSALHIVLPSQLEFEKESCGNVLLLLDNNIRFTSHTCFLSFSPVLKSILMNVEVRLDKPCISLPGFSEKSVQHLLQFLHRGYVGNKNEILNRNKDFEMFPDLYPTPNQ